MRFVAWGVRNLYLLKINRGDPIGFSFYDLTPVIRIS